MEYTLENECLKVTFHSLGGALHSIQDRDGTEYLWQGDEKYWSGRAPVLFPICGSLRGDEAVCADGRKIQMPRHGIVRKKEFSCRKQEADRIEFSIESDEGMYQQYPWRFCLSVSYVLRGSQIVTEYTVENRDNTKMPFFIGAHPGFNCPLYPQESYEDYKVVFSCEENCTVPKPLTDTGLIDMGCRTKLLENQNELALSHDLFAEDAIILDELRSRSVSMCGRKHGRGVRVDFEDFPYLVLWSSPNKGPFLAVEPWMGLSTCSDEDDCFEGKRNIQSAGAFSSRQYSYTISILQPQCHCYNSYSL